MTSFNIYIYIYDSLCAKKEEARKRAEMQEFQRAGEEALRIMRAAKEVRYSTHSGRTLTDEVFYPISCAIY